MWGCIIAVAITFPLVFGWIHFQTLPEDLGRYQIFLFSITSEYYVLMVMSPEGNQGRARWELKRARHALQDELV